MITPLQGIADRAGGRGRHLRVRARRSPQSAPLTGRLLAAADGEAVGSSLDYFPAGDLSGAPLHRETLLETMAIWLGEPAPGVPAGDFSAR